MTDRSPDNPFEPHRLELLGNKPNDLAALVLDRFNADFPAEGLYSGTWRQRLSQFLTEHVHPICKKAGSVGDGVWNALRDEHTAHNVERFALVCGFFASEVFPHGHWPTHEIAALVLLIVSALPKGTDGG